MNLIEKYKPKKSNNIIGQYYGVKNLREWLSKWNKEQKLKAALISTLKKMNSLWMITLKT